LNIALIGYGKMGKAIEQEAVARGHKIVLAMDLINKDLTAETLKAADVAIEFTRPEAAIDNIYKCFDAGIPVIVGTTGWYDRYDEVKQKCIDTNNTLFTATNFSIGVNIMFAINTYLAKIMNGQPSYSASMAETHHIQKLDAPSGTAITLAEQIINNHDGYKNWGLAGRDNITNGIVPITAHRMDDVPGMHEVIYKNEIDEISIRHNAFSRKGFAQGAVIAAEWLNGKKGVHTMGDMLKF
jgi:4-hydroxy-tetrahydrodipicolinate reductase